MKIETAIKRAQSAIDKDKPVIYDVASACGQIAGNVKHMPWFLEAVADHLELYGSRDKGSEGRF